MILPPNILKCMSKADRDSLGKGGLLPEEALARAEAKSERDLQRLIVNLLMLKGIEPLWHRTDKKSAATIGWPDLTFAVQAFAPVFDRQGQCYDMITQQAVCWEVKFAKGALSLDQQRMSVRLSTPPNGWIVKTITSVDEAIAELKELGL